MDDLIFLHRNRNYGAYVLRLNYSRTMTKAVVLASFIFLLIVCLPVIMNAIYKNGKVDEICDDNGGVIYFQDIPLQKLNEEKKVVASTGSKPNAISTKVVKDKTNLVEKPNLIDSLAVAENGKSDYTALENVSTSTTTSGNSSGIEETEVLKDSKIFNYTEVMPQYPGGQSAMYNFISKNMHYPGLAFREEIEGLVIVQFIVRADGKIDNTRIVRSLGYGCDEEAVRVIQSMPDWKPGKHNGKEVPVLFSIPIKFALIK